ncbi:hypothetical protein A9Q99_19010 [Gammaproteobacteria bacterium 45_16_T64]|nr:hypothetical protein A9Q99_19010 [Gammaproteobacteria bacterium 45_16_T64]
MSEFFVEFWNHPDFIKYAIIPLIAAGVGWVTNWVAIQMTFYPTTFIGIPPILGWQGIIPAKGEKMAGIVVDNTLAKISTIQEIFQEFEPDAIAHHIIKVADSRIEEFTDDIMNDKNAILWENLPNIMKNRAYASARKQLPKIMDSLMEDLQANIEDLIDPKALIISKLTEDKAMLNRVFQECGEAEFKFIINSGLYFGFLFGIIQMFAWYVFAESWLLPAFGLLVGLATNWLALRLIFQPLNPIYVFGIKIQGLFLSRQNAVSEVFCRIITAEVLTIGSVMNEIFRGPKSDRTKSLIKKHLRPLIDGGLVKTVAQLTVGPEGFVDLKRTIEAKTIEMSLESFDDPQFTRERGVVIEKMFRERMQAMTSEEFQDLLRPAFQEDEWILIVVGGALGLAAGFAQLFFMFAST